MSASPMIMIAEARFYNDIADMLLKGVCARLDERNAKYEVFSVPGALELPAALKYGHSGQNKGRFEAFIALGCVIRGETSHYDLVSGESARGIMDLMVNYNMPIANGILTTENKEQAIARADSNQKNKGAHFADAALDLWALKQELGV